MNHEQARNELEVAALDFAEAHNRARCALGVYDGAPIDEIRHAVRNHQEGLQAAFKRLSEKANAWTRSELGTNAPPMDALTNVVKLERQRAQQEHARAILGEE